MNNGYIIGHILGKNHAVTIYNNSGDIFFDMTGKGQNLYSISNSCDLQLHMIGFGVGLFANNTSGGEKILYLYNNSVVDISNSSSVIHARYYDQCNVSHNGSAGTIEWCEFSKGTHILLSPNSLTHYTNCKFSASGYYSLPTDYSFENKELTNNGSNFFKFVDITGLSSIDLQNANWSGLFFITSTNPTETVNQIFNAPQDWDYVVVPYNSLILTLTSVDYDVATSNQLVLKNHSDKILTARPFNMADVINLSSKNPDGIVREISANIMY